MLNCSFCNAPLDPPGTLGQKVKCPEADCGYVYKITVYGEAPASVRSPTQDQEPGTEAE